jgi:hypothetical protein
MKLLADAHQTVVGVEVVVEPVPVELPPVVVPVQVRDIEVAVRIAPYALYKIPSVPLPIEFSPSCILFGI